VPFNVDVPFAAIVELLYFVKVVDAGKVVVIVVVTVLGHHRQEQKKSVDRDR